MKKIIIFFLISLSFFSSLSNAAECTYDPNGPVTSSFQNCMPKGALEAKENKSTGLLGGIIKLSSNNGGSGGYTIDVAKNKVIYVTEKLVIVAGILAVGGVAYSGMMFVLGLGDGEKMKKAKGALKWSLLGFLIAIISQQLINATINLIFSLSN